MDKTSRPGEPRTADIRARVIEGAHPGRFLISRHTGAAFTAAATTFEALGWAVRDMRDRRTLRRVIQAAGPAIEIAGASPGMVRVQGVVELLQGVPFAGSQVAAYLKRSAELAPCTCNAWCEAKLKVIATRRAAGRFLVRDDTGVAVVPSGKIRLLDFHGRAPDPFEAGAISVRAGDHVTIIGEATMEHAAGLPAATFRGFREAPTVLTFQGTSAPTHVFVPPESRPRPL